MLEFVSSQVARSIERKRAEDALRRNQQRLSLHIQQTPLAVIEWDTDFRVLKWNDSAERIFGYTAAEAVGQHASFIVPESFKAQVDEVWTDLMAGRGGPAQHQRERHQGRPGDLLRMVQHRARRRRTARRSAWPPWPRTSRHRQQAEESLREGLAKLRSTLKASIDSLASAIEMRDPYTAGHQERVTRLARAIAAEMGLAEERVEAIEIAGVIHDLGKLYVPAEILSKPTKLTELEYAMIKMHPQAGYTILSKIDFPWPIAQIVHQHHELVNGSGYPQGLAGKDDPARGPDPLRRRRRRGHVLPPSLPARPRHRGGPRRDRPEAGHPLRPRGRRRLSAPVPREAVQVRMSLAPPGP